MRVVVVELVDQHHVGAHLLQHGRDLARVSFKRKLGGKVKVPAVEVVAVDTSSTRRGLGAFLKARYPDDSEDADDRQTSDLAADGRSDKRQVLTIPVHGIRDSKRLRELARDLFEEIGRGEIGGSAETSELASFGGDNADPDLLRLQPGDTVQIQVDTSALSSVPPVMSELQHLSRVPDAEAIKLVAARLGGDPVEADNLARILVGTLRGRIVQLQDVFRVNTVRLTYQSGVIKISFDYSNYSGLRFDSATAKAKVQSRQRPRAVPTAMGGMSGEAEG